MSELEDAQYQTTSSESSHENPMGTNGFEFVEFAAPDPKALRDLFHSLGFKAVAKHRSKDITLFKQGDINFILNAQKDSFAEQFSKTHGPCACAMAFKVENAQYAFQRAISLGARSFKPERKGQGELNVPAIYGIGDSLLYFVDQTAHSSIYEVDFEPFNDPNPVRSVGLTAIDHLTHNVYRGQMDHWAKFYEKFFNFREIRFFDIQGQQTGLVSRALTSPCNKIKIPLNEPKDDKSQIQEYLETYQGEGIQHIALYTDNIYDTIEALRANGIQFLTIPDTYYEIINDRIKGHREDLDRLKKNKILMDGDPYHHKGLLLQIFTENVVGPIFFEIIQRKGNDGFGEGNFQALFDSMELDQIRRGVLKAPNSK